MRTALQKHFLFLLFVIVISPLEAIGVEHAHLEAAYSSITSNELQRHIEILADDTFEGRAAGTRGGHAAGGYLRSIFEANNLQGGADDEGYYQVFGEGNRNILGILPGSDDKLKREFVVICAHYDHVGYGTPRNSFGPTGFIHNGADDNASGTAAVLELVDAMVNHMPRQRRSILFVLWDGEESGLLGSKHWAEEPTIDIDQITLAINMDMVGRFRENLGCEVHGTRSAAGLRQCVAQHNQGIDLPLSFPWKMKDNSDHYSFFERDVPVLMFHTGLHDEYHRPSDDADLINHEDLQRIVQLILGVVVTAANQEERYLFREAARSETDSMKQRYETSDSAPPRRMGFSWDAESTEPGLAIVSVTRNSPAEQAGMRRGDRLLRFAGVEVNTTEEFRSIGPKVGGDVELHLLRNGEEITRIMHLPLPDPLGAQWRESDAEPGIVTLIQIEPGTAADDAALHAGDRIHKIGSESFVDAADFELRLEQQEGEVDFLIERRGCFHTIPVHFLPRWVVAE